MASFLRRAAKSGTVAKGNGRQAISMRGVQKSFAEILYKWTDWVGKELKKIKKVKVYSAPNPAGIVSFDIQGIPSGEVADILNGEFDVAVRSGLHCAPLIHKKLKTEENGLTRASFSVQNTERELAEFCRAVNVIASR